MIVKALSTCLEAHNRAAAAFLYFGLIISDRNTNSVIREAKRRVSIR